MDTDGRGRKAGAAQPVKSGPLLVNADESVRLWVGARLDVKFPDYCTAVGVIRGEKMVAGVVYQPILVNGRTWMVEASIASDHPAWASRMALYGLFWVAFVHLKAVRLQTRCKADADDIRAFNKRLGFTEEGLMREGWPLGGDAYLFSMLRQECKWIEK